MGARMPGPLGFLDLAVALDDGTVSQQRNHAPGPMSGNGNAYYAERGPILVGKPPRDPGKDEKGNVYEDMLFNDKPANAVRRLAGDKVFTLPDAKLQELGLALMDSVSTTGGFLQAFNLNAVARACWARFCAGTGGTFTDPVLTAAVEANMATKVFVLAFGEQLRLKLIELKGDPKPLGIKPLELDGYAFDTNIDKATGLGIIIHDWWSIKAELMDYTATWDGPSDTGAFSGKLAFTMTDDFGLDLNDIALHGNDIIPPTLDPQFETGDRFKAWYVLQHFRTPARPFFVQVKLTYDFTDRPGMPV